MEGDNLGIQMARVETSLMLYLMLECSIWWLNDVGGFDSTHKWMLPHNMLRKSVEETALGWIGCSDLDRQIFVNRLYRERGLAKECTVSNGIFSWKDIEAASSSGWNK